MVKIEVDVIQCASDLEIEYRLQHIATGEFVDLDGKGERTMVQHAQHATFFGSTLTADGKERSDEGTLEFQWAWNRDECDQLWMKNADMQEYRVHKTLNWTS